MFTNVKTVHKIVIDFPKIGRVRCDSFNPSVVSIGAVSGRRIATVIVHTVVLDDYCVLTS